MRKVVVLIALAAPLFSCTEKDPENPDPQSFEEVIELGGDFEPTLRSEEVVDDTTGTEIVNGEVWICTTRTLSALTPSGGQKGFPLFNPNASVIYPGSLLQGKSLKQATPDVISVDRAGGTVSYDLNNGNLASYFTVDKVSKSAIQNAMNQIIYNAPPDLPANFDFSYSQVQSEQALALALGIDYESAFVEVQSDFSFSTGSSLNRILVELNQAFYTMSFDLPTGLDDLFAPSVTPADLARYVQEGNPATYISDVTYGRIYYMLIESTSSYQEMETEISASFNGIKGSAEADISGHSLSNLENLKIKVMAFGGEATTSLLTVGETDLSRLVSLLAESTTITTGLPISYVVRSVYSDQIVSVQLATEYDITECEPAPEGGAPPYTVHWEGQVLLRMGPVGAAYATNGTEFILINDAGTQFMRSNVGMLEGPFPVSDLGGGAEPPFAGIGAACNLDGNIDNDGWIMIMDMTGSLYSYIRGDTAWSSNVQAIGDLAFGQNPFALNGIGAMLFREQRADGSSNRWMINRDGTGFTLYHNNPKSFSHVENIEDWAGGGMPFEVKKVGAGIGFFLGEKRFYLLFDYTGTQYCISGDVFGKGTNEFIGPFDL